MAKTKIELEEGMLFSIKLNEQTWTFAQLCNLFKIEGKRYVQHTLAFFNHIFLSEDELQVHVQTLDLSNPIIIMSINGNPIKNYGLNIIGAREIDYQNVPNFKKEISQSLGMYRNKSHDFDHILETFFGFRPWDGFYKDNYVDELLTSGTTKRTDVKYLKDFTIEELKQIMPADSMKLKQLLQNQ